MTAPLDMGRYFQRRGVPLTDRDRVLRASTAHPVDAVPPEEKPRELTAAQRDGAPMLAGLCGYDPERVEQLRAGYWPEWAR